MDILLALFCVIDDFCKIFEPELNKRLLEDGQRKRCREASLSLSELMTLVVFFHQTRYRQFKAFYWFYVRHHLRAEFPRLPSYQRCVALMPRCLIALTAFFETIKGHCTGLSIVDSTPIAVCDNLRIGRHRVFQGLAARGKTSTGWFFGLKLHVIINHLGELLAVKLTPGNVDDRQPLKNNLCQNIFGRLYADRGYLGLGLTDWLKERGITFVHRVRKNMKRVIYSAFDHAMLKRRSLIETVFDQLKNLCQIEHTRHRSVVHFLVNLMAGIVAYCLAPNKPSLPVSYEPALS